LGLDEVFPDPLAPKAPIDYGILCSLFPEYCGRGGGGDLFEIVRDVTSETGGGGGGTGGCNCLGTTDCSIYDRLCQDAKRLKLNSAAIEYYCKASKKVCNKAPKTGFGSCTSNCIRKCLQDWEKTNVCLLAGAFVGTDKFVACEAAIHLDCYASCLPCAL
jgi:hypothetical protein